jgi:NAD+ synthase
MTDVAAADGTALFELPDELAIDTDIARRVIGAFIRGQLRQAGFEKAVLALSGGIDSALVAYLVAEAIGADRLLCVLMPYRTSAEASRSDAEEVVRRLGAASELVEISPMVDAFFAADPDATPLRRGNFMARQRMAVAYDRSVTWSGLVVGTGNKTESLIGYTTLFGDNACAFNPIGDLYKSQVRQLAAALGVPDEIIRKAPSADLWPGQTDETEAGFTYPVLDRLLFWRVDKRRSDEEMTALGFDPALVANLDAEAIGADRLLCVLMPYRTSADASLTDAEEVDRRLGAASELVEISPMVDAFFAADPDATPLRRGNFMARQRMAVVYDRSVTWSGLVVGTGNKTESLIGYTTLFGDNACAFNPIGDLYKSQVRHLAAALGVPDEIIRKAPSADLWPGQTDETEAGFTYPVLDRLLFWRVDKRRSDEEMTALGFDPALVARVDRMIATSEFKRQVPPIAKLGPRTAGVDYRYPRRRPGSARG